MGAHHRAEALAAEPAGREGVEAVHHREEPEVPVARLRAGEEGARAG